MGTGTKADSQNPHDDEFRLINEEKFIERLKRMDHKKLISKIVAAEFQIKAAEEFIEEHPDDTRNEHAWLRVNREHKLVHAEVQRRKENGYKIPPVTIAAETLRLGSKTGLGQ